MPAPIPSLDPRIDAYVAKAAPFARPILLYLRDVVHAACPEVVETIKWGMPFFDHHGPLCNMAAFKAHCAFGFWRGKAMSGLPDGSGAGGMGQFGRILSLEDLPPRDALVELVQDAARNNASGPKPARPKATPKPELAMPDDFASALDGHPDASRCFDGFTPGARREYLDWILEAKREATRAARIGTAIAWIAEGKTRHWKYQR